MSKCGFTITLFFLLLFSLRSNAQSFDYSYVDPCTGINKTIQVPSNGITLTYYNQVNTFQAADFYNGVFESWSQSVYRNFGNNNPCSKIIGIPGAINIGQQTSLTLFGIINSISSAMEARESALGNVDLLSSSISGVQKTEGKKSQSQQIPSVNSTINSNVTSTSSESSTNSTGGNTDNNSSTSVDVGKSNSIQNSDGNNNSSNSNTNNTSSNKNSVTSGANSSGESSDKSTNTSSTSDGKSGDGGTSGVINRQSNTQGNVDNQEVPSDQQQSSTTNGSKKTDLLGNTVAALGNISSSSNKNGNKPTIVGGGDFVGFNFFNSDIRYGGKFTASYTSIKWDGSSVHGLIADYTSSINGPNIAGFYAKIHKRRIDIASASFTMGFSARGSLYGTLAVGQMWTIKKNLKAIYLATGSFGNIYQEKFLGTILISGGMYDMKINKRFSVKMMCLYVYAPYVSYYNDLLLKSPHVVLPILGTNINITKTFKFNINTGGAWAIKENTLNYTVVMGTRLIF